MTKLLTIILYSCHDNAPRDTGSRKRWRQDDGTWRPRLGGPTGRGHSRPGRGFWMWASGGGGGGPGPAPRPRKTVAGSAATGGPCRRRLSEMHTNAATTGVANARAPPLAVPAGRRMVPRRRSAVVTGPIVVRQLSSQPPPPYHSTNLAPVVVGRRCRASLSSRRRVPVTLANPVSLAPVSDGFWVASDSICFIRIVHGLEGKMTKKNFYNVFRLKQLLKE